METQITRRYIVMKRGLNRLIDVIKRSVYDNDPKIKQELQKLIKDLKENEGTQRD